MADFSHLDRLDVKVDQLAKYKMHQIAGAPTLLLAPAMESNKFFFNAMLKRSRKSARQLRAGAINQALISENRGEDRELYPIYIIKGWEDMKDAGGVAVKFDMKACHDFLEALPDWLFDDVREFAGNPNNFVEMMDDADIEDKAGN